MQGVGYRVFALREAMALGLDGSVANRGDGSVRVVAEGPRRDLETLLARLGEGPPAGWVDDVLTRWEPARGVEPGFRIATGSTGATDRRSPACRPRGPLRTCVTHA